MAKMVEVKADLFKSMLLNKPGTMILHCVSADYALGAGFALQLEKRYHVRDILKQIGSYQYPDCIVTGQVINMVTKGVYWGKPSYYTFTTALVLVRNYCISNNIETLVMPRIGCGLDKLDWKKCKEIITEQLVNNGMNCCVYRIK